LGKLFVLEVSLLLTCFLGDHLLTHPVTNQRYLVAIGDSLTHGFVGAISWVIVIDAKNRHDIAQCLLCLMFAMAVDVDHFIAAKSLSLEAALSLPSRPPFHATTVIFLVDLILLIMAAILKSGTPLTLALMFTVAWFSHHVRDGTRRGLWLPPFTETPPLSGLAYLGLIMVIPLLGRILYTNWLQFSTDRQLKIIESNIV
ncbi:TM267-like protein, partial [Mya arenaria]